MAIERRTPEGLETHDWGGEVRLVIVDTRDRGETSRCPVLNECAVLEFPVESPSRGDDIRVGRTWYCFENVQADLTRFLSVYANAIVPGDGFGGLSNYPHLCEVCGTSTALHLNPSPSLSLQSSKISPNLNMLESDSGAFIKLKQRRRGVYNSQHLRSTSLDHLLIPSPTRPGWRHLEIQMRMAHLLLNLRHDNPPTIEPAEIAVSVGDVVVI